jgi:hypothetical protein
MPPENTVLMEGVRIIFRNFRGEEGKFNKEGERNFAVLLDNPTAEAMTVDGWNVKHLNPRDEEEEQNPQAYLPVAVEYQKGRPPKIYLITGEGTRKRLLEENEVEDLDWADITNVDMIVRPYNWDVNGKQGVKAYVQSMYVAIEEDELAKKYAELEQQ